MTALSKPGFKLVAVATAVTCLVVILGAFTRLVDAGLGCPDWPGCYGQLLWPDTPAEIALAESKFPDAPVEMDKTWPEMVHRYFASSLGLLIIAICWVSVRAARQSSNQNLAEKQPVKLPFFLLGLVILQGMFGMWTVTLKLWPQVVTAHLLGGMATLSCLWLLTQRLSGQSWSFNAQASERVSQLKHLSFAVLLLVIVQIALGGWTSSNYAALACMDLPRCQGQWLPPVDFVEAFNFTQQVGPNYLGGLLNNEARTAIHLSHRVGAVVVSLSVLLLSWRLFAVGEAKTRRMAAVLVSVLSLQVLLGLSNIYWALPLSVAVAHNAVGALLLLCMVTLNHRVFTLPK